MLGPRLTELASVTISDELITVADPILQKLSLEADASTQLYRRQGDWLEVVQAPVGVVKLLTAFVPSALT